MKKIVLLFLCFLSFNAFVFAQTVKYTTHTIAQGETLSAIAGKYHSTVGDIMRLNGMNSKSVLKIGEKIKIPVTSKTEKNKTAATPVAPVAVASNTGKAVHIVQAHETLYGISKKYGVTIDQLKQWNNLPGANLEVGQQLAVSADGVATVAVNKKETISKTAVTAQETVRTPEKIDAVNEAPGPGIANKVNEPPVVVPATNTSNTAVQNKVAAAAAKDGSDSYFANDFIAEAGKRVNEATGEAMTFKTASGWLDKKYYILTNAVPAGSIVKISADNGNSIYAKVLWTLDDMKLNKGLTFRISEAAAAALSVAENKFNLTVNFHE